MFPCPLLYTQRCSAITDALRLFFNAPPCRRTSKGCFRRTSGGATPMLRRNQVALECIVNPRVRGLKIEPDTWRSVCRGEVGDLGQGFEVRLSEDGNEIIIRIANGTGLRHSANLQARSRRIALLTNDTADADPSPLSMDLDRFSRLPPRQREVLDLLVWGKSNKEIARELSLKVGTVKVHLTALLRNLGVNNRSAAAAIGACLLSRGGAIQ